MAESYERDRHNGIRFKTLHTSISYPRATHTRWAKVKVLIFERPPNWCDCKHVLDILIYTLIHITMNTYVSTMRGSGPTANDSRRREYRSYTQCPMEQQYARAAEARY